MVAKLENTTDSGIPLGIESPTNELMLAELSPTDCHEADLFSDDKVVTKEVVDQSAISLLLDLCSTPAMRRLEHIGFLGALEFLQHGNGPEFHRRRHNRLEHSICVARLMLLYARTAHLDARTTKTLVAAALLHDVGHGPLSHTLEPVFKSEFGLSHHLVGDGILTGLSPLSKTLLATLQTHGVDRDEILLLLHGRSASTHAFAFSGPINFDTLEGITRSRFFAGSWDVALPTRQIARDFARKSPNVRLLDAFWSLKDQVYATLIHSRSGLLLDAIAQAYMRKRLNEFHPSDFMRDERQLRRRHGGLFSLLGSAKSIYRLMANIPRRLLDDVVTIRRRRFLINRESDSSTIVGLKNRYEQKQSIQTITLEELLLPQSPRSEIGVRKVVQPDMIDERLIVS